MPTSQHKLLRRAGACLLVLATIVFAACSKVSPPESGVRPATWATPVLADAGVPNLHRMNANLYRSAQPTAAGFAFLNRQSPLVAGDRPIKTVLSLRTFNDDDGLQPPSPTLRLEQIRFKTWHPEREDIVKFLRIATTPELQPLLVHCQHGSDRTGTMNAIYRIAVQGWSKEEAVREMTGGGYGFHPMWQNLKDFIGALDIDAVKREVAAQGPWK